MTEPVAQVDGVGVSASVFERLSEIVGDGGQALRVAVLGGGCSGFQYKFELDDSVADDDIVIAKGDLRVIVDAVSQPFLDGAVINYKDELIGAHFAVENPNATASCGCGTSFSI